MRLYECVCVGVSGTCVHAFVCVYVCAYICGRCVRLCECVCVCALACWDFKYNVKS